MGCGVEPRVELALRRTLFFSIFLFAYLVFGACVFSLVPNRSQPLKCEKDAEKLDARRTEMLNVLWAETMAQSEHEWAHMAHSKLEMYERALLTSCSSREPRSTSFSSSFMHAFSLITTIGFVDADSLTTGGKLFAIAYAVAGIPLALLYLGQCSKIVAGVLPGDRVIAASFVLVFVTAIVYDIVEDSEDDTSFIDAVFYAFMFMTTVGRHGQAPNGILAVLALIAMSLVSISFVVLERHIENSVQGFEMAFTRQCAWMGRWLNTKSEDNDRIIEEEDEEAEDSEYS